MRGKIAKLARKVALTNPYGVADIDGETKYGQSKMSPKTRVLSPGIRLSTKYIKRFYKQGKFTSADMRSEVARFKEQQSTNE